MKFSHPDRRWMVFLVSALTLVMLLAMGCGASAPAPVPAAQPASGMDPEALRSLVSEAVSESASSGVTAQEVETLVAKAVSESTAAGVTARQAESLVARTVSQSAPSGVTAQEVESSVARAVAEAMEAQKAQEATTAEPSSIVLTDVAGRTVTIDMPVERVILGEGRQIYIVAALQPGNPFQRIIGWRDDLRRADADTYIKYKEIFPELADIAEFGSPTSGEFSVEQAIALQADVVTLNLGSLERATEAGMIDQLEEVGIPVVVIDFRQEPLENTVPSTILLGRLFGQEERAQEIVDFYLQQVNLVYSRIDGIEKEEAAGVPGPGGWNTRLGRLLPDLWQGQPGPHYRAGRGHKHWLGLDSGMGRDAEPGADYRVQPRRYHRYRLELVRHQRGRRLRQHGLFYRAGRFQAGAAKPGPGPAGLGTAWER